MAQSDASPAAPEPGKFWLGALVGPTINHRTLASTGSTTVLKDTRDALEIPIAGLRSGLSLEYQLT